MFKHYYPQFPPEGQALLGLVLYREATAHEDRGDLDSAIPAYEAAREALLQVGDAATAGLVSVDLAYAILSQGGPKAVEEAVRIHGAVDPNLLDPRGRFAYLFVAAQIAYSRERYEEAQQLVRQAHIAAGEVPDALVWERAALAFLHACITLSLGDRTKALAYALRAAAGFDQSHDQRRLDQCHRLISQLLGLSE